ncbi:MAG: hypothetical protein BWX80_01911 [Candidatus Hydrogenedentes bacterium ADurb.Bin101]|nr:MAG: hypothetical protein BWX80_01911 [Candidatus Hydrogenedentes bacterium ADurb.Bin101]
MTGTFTFAFILYRRFPFRREFSLHCRFTFHRGFSFRWRFAFLRGGFPFSRKQGSTYNHAHCKNSLVGGGNGACYVGLGHYGEYDGVRRWTIHIKGDGNLLGIRFGNGYDRFSNRETGGVELEHARKLPGRVCQLMFNYFSLVGVGTFHVVPEAAGKRRQGDREFFTLSFKGREFTFHRILALFGQLAFGGGQQGGQVLTIQYPVRVDIQVIKFAAVHIVGNLYELNQPIAVIVYRGHDIITDDQNPGDG